METKNETLYGGTGYGYSGTDPLAWLAANQTAEIRRDVAKSEADIKHMLGDGFCGTEKSIGDTRRDIAKSEADIKYAVGEGFCGVEKSIGDAECAVIDKLGNYAADNFKNQSDIAQRQSDWLGTYSRDNFKNQSDIAQRQGAALNSVERDLQNRIHENRMILTKEIGDKNDRTIDIFGRDILDVKNQLRYFETSTAEKFCRLETDGLKNTQKILDTLAANKYDALKDELDETRASKYADKYAHGFALQTQDINYLKQMINSVEQTQKFNSKTVQFGAGNVAIPTQTANQG